MEYLFEDGACVPQRVHTVVISTQHDENVSQEQLKKDLMEKVIRPVIPDKLMDSRTVFHLNPSGKFIIGGPMVSGNTAVPIGCSHWLTSLAYSGRVPAHCAVSSVSDPSICMHAGGVPALCVTQVRPGSNLCLLCDRVMLASLAGRSSLIRTAAGELTVVALSLARITPRSTDPLPTPPDGWPSPSSKLGSAVGAWCR